MKKPLKSEYWREGQLENRFDVKRRVIAIEGPWMGLDMGGIMQNEVIVAELSHPAHTIIDMGENALVGSWFHLHMVKPDGIFGLLKHREWLNMYLLTVMVQLY